MALRLRLFQKRKSNLDNSIRLEASRGPAGLDKKRFDQLERTSLCISPIVRLFDWKKAEPVVWAWFVSTWRETGAGNTKRNLTQWGSISPRWQHLSRMIACCVLHYLNFLFFEQNEPFFNRDKCYHLTLCSQMRKPHSSCSFFLGAGVFIIRPQLPFPPT